MNSNNNNLNNNNQNIMETKNYHHNDRRNNEDNKYNDNNHRNYNQDKRNSRLTQDIRSPSSRYSRERKYNDLIGNSRYDNNQSNNNLNRNNSNEEGDIKFNNSKNLKNEIEEGEILLNKRERYGNNNKRYNDDKNKNDYNRNYNYQRYSPKNYYDNRNKYNQQRNNYKRIDNNSSYYSHNSNNNNDNNTFELDPRARLRDYTDLYPDIIPPPETLHPIKNQDNLNYNIEPIKSKSNDIRHQSHHNTQSFQLNQQFKNTENKKRHYPSKRRPITIEKCDLKERLYSKDWISNEVAEWAKNSPYPLWIMKELKKGDYPKDEEETRIQYLKKLDQIYQYKEKKRIIIEKYKKNQNNKLNDQIDISKPIKDLINEFNSNNNNNNNNILDKQFKEEDLPFAIPKKINDNLLIKKYQFETKMIGKRIKKVLTFALDHIKNNIKRLPYYSVPRYKDTKSIGFKYIKENKDKPLIKAAVPYNIDKKLQIPPLATLNLNSNIIKELTLVPRPNRGYDLRRFNNCLYKLLEEEKGRINNKEEGYDKTIEQALFDRESNQNFNQLNLKEIQSLIKIIKNEDEEIFKQINLEENQLCYLSSLKLIKRVLNWLKLLDYYLNKKDLTAEMKYYNVRIVTLKIDKLREIFNKNQSHPMVGGLLEILVTAISYIMIQVTKELKEYSNFQQSLNLIYLENFIEYKSKLSQNYALQFFNIKNIQKNSPFTYQRIQNQEILLPYLNFDNVELYHLCLFLDSLIVETIAAKQGRLPNFQIELNWIEEKQFKEKEKNLEDMNIIKVENNKEIKLNYLIDNEIEKNNNQIINNEDLIDTQFLVNPELEEGEILNES